MTSGSRFESLKKLRPPEGADKQRVLPKHPKHWTLVHAILFADVHPASPHLYCTTMDIIHTGIVVYNIMWDFIVNSSCNTLLKQPIQLLGSAAR